ncbi:MAG: helix-turn-helix domain-containing protein [Candidatus Parabeggiatoa sp.]|nr:helix-turn-helix domain-containing protein [Candidatus Parabeggiatoa sp.]
MPKKDIIRLLSEEREHLNQVIKKLKGSGQKVRRAHILLKADANGPNWTDQKIADAFSCRIKTVENIRQRFVEQGFQQTLEGKKREQPPTPKSLNGEQEAKIIAMRLGPPPPGYANWTLRLLACRVVELEIVESISHDNRRQTLKKNGMTQRKIAYWVIPPNSDAEFVANISACFRNV